MVKNVGRRIQHTRQKLNLTAQLPAPHALRHAFRTRTCAIAFISADLLWQLFLGRTTLYRREQLAEEEAVRSRAPSL